MVVEEMWRILHSSSDIIFAAKNINSVMLKFACLREGPRDPDSQWCEHSLSKAEETLAFLLPKLNSPARSSL